MPTTLSARSHSMPRWNVKLTVVWGANCFCNFVTGMTVVVFTDHKQVVQVFAPAYNVATASSCVQRLVLKVQDLQLNIQYQPGKLNYNEPHSYLCSFLLFRVVIFLLRCMFCIYLPTHTISS